MSMSQWEIDTTKQFYGSMVEMRKAEGQTVEALDSNLMKERLITSLLSDVQELIDLNKPEEAKELINKVKYMYKECD